MTDPAPIGTAPKKPRKARKPRRDARYGPDRCITCGRRVDPFTPVSHALRGLHTCRTPDGTVPPYLDADTAEEAAALDAYLATRLASKPS